MNLNTFRIIILSVCKGESNDLELLVLLALGHHEKYCRLQFSTDILVEISLWISWHYQQQLMHLMLLLSFGFICIELISCLLQKAVLCFTINTTVERLSQSICNSFDHNRREGRKSNPGNISSYKNINTVSICAGEFSQLNYLGISLQSPEYVQPRVSILPLGSDQYGTELICINEHDWMTIMFEFRY